MKLENVAPKGDATAHGATPARKDINFPSLSIVSPAYNERGNIFALTQAIDAAMGDISWELIIVDDDSPDGTADECRRIALLGFPIQCVRRVGRRGLSSAVVEGALAARADTIAVIDADLQHDERLLPRMLHALTASDVDLVVGSRHVEGGGLGDWSRTRQRMSSFATWCARRLVHTDLTDPMSGFFALKRDVFYECIYNLSQQGYKILIDIVSSSPRKLTIVELPYEFRNRMVGESKVDIMTLAEYAFLLIDKITRGWIPPRFVLFCAVGTIGLLVHLLFLNIFRFVGTTFNIAQVTATLAAMTFNYIFNNSFTYRSQRLRGYRFFVGYFVFCIICSVGGLANVGIADVVLAGSDNWQLAGIAGALMSAVFNFGAASQFVWTHRRIRNDRRQTVS